MSTEHVRVELGARSYDVAIGPGLIAEAGARIAALFPGRNTVIVTDANVAERLLPALRASLNKAGIDAAEIIVPPGEGSKSFERLQSVVEAILDSRRERNDVVLALGGGVIGDLAGFAAASHDAACSSFRCRHAPCASRLKRRRQDRHQRTTWQEPHRRFLAAGAVLADTENARPLPSASSAPATRRWPRSD